MPTSRLFLSMTHGMTGVISRIKLHAVVDPSSGRTGIQHEAAPGFGCWNDVVGVRCATVQRLSGSPVLRNVGACGNTGSRPLLVPRTAKSYSIWTVRNRPQQRHKQALRFGSAPPFTFLCIPLHGSSACHSLNPLQSRRKVFPANSKRPHHDNKFTIRLAV